MDLSAISITSPSGFCSDGHTSLSEPSARTLDYAQLMLHMDTIIAHEEVASLVRQLGLSGSGRRVDLLRSLRLLVADGQKICQAVADSQWYSQYFHQHLSILRTALDFLSRAEQTSYQATLDYNIPLQAEGYRLYGLYKEEMNTLLTLLGV